MDKRLSRRLDKIENKMRVDNNSDGVPLVIVTKCDGKNTGKGVEVVYGDDGEQGDEQQAITTA